MTTRRTPRRNKISDLDWAGLAEPVDPDELLWHWLPSYVPSRSVCENAFSLARPLWGKARAEWTWCLAEEVAARFPETNEPNEGRGWVAGVLWAAAVDAGMQRSNELWLHVLADITKMTGVSEQTAELRWQMMNLAGLDVPAHPPSYWR